MMILLDSGRDSHPKAPTNVVDWLPKVRVENRCRMSSGIAKMAVTRNADSPAQSRRWSRSACYTRLETDCSMRTAVLDCQ